MTGNNYRPSEVDEDAYGPAPDEPPLPPWNPQTDGERDTFLRWCLAMLDRREAEPVLERAMRELQADGQAVELLRDLVEQPMFEQACEQLPFLTRDAFRLYRHGPQEAMVKQPTKRGIKGNVNVAAAVIDNARLTTLFRQHFGGNYRRPSKPSRIDILRARHGLAEWECRVVERYLD